MHGSGSRTVFCFQYVFFEFIVVVNGYFTKIEFFIIIQVGFNIIVWVGGQHIYLVYLTQNWGNEFLLRSQYPSKWLQYPLIYLFLRRLFSKPGRLRIKNKE